MDTPVRKYQKQKDYQRHKLFRKMKRRRRAAIEQAKDAPMKQLRRKLKIPKFEDGKDDKPNVFQLPDGTSQPSQQMDRPNIFRYDDGRYVYQASPNAEEIEVSPINTLLPNPSQWTYQDASGKIYTPHTAQVDTGSIIQDEERNPLVRAANNYFKEAAYRAKDGTLALQGKYTMPAIAASALLPVAGEAAYPILTNPYVDAGIASAFAGHGLNHAINEGIDGWGDAAMTALEVAPLGRLAKPMWNVVKPTRNFIPTTESNMAGVRYAYNRNPELVNIGTLEDYNNYLKTVFPESKVKDINYHMGPKGLQELNPSTGEVWNTNPDARGIYVTPDKSYAQKIRKFTTDRLEKPSAWTYLKRNLTPGGWDKANETFTDIYPVMVDAKKPLLTKGDWTWGIKDKKYQSLMNDYDAIVNSGPKWYQNFNSMPETIVPKTEQALILGSDADVAGFRKFMSAPQITAENAASITPESPLIASAMPDYSSELGLDYNMLGKYINEDGSLRKVHISKTVTENPSNNIDYSNVFKVDPDKRFMIFEPGSFINYDIGSMSIDDVVKTFGPEAEYYKKLYDVAKAHNFEGKYAEIGKNAEYNILNRFAIDKSDPDVARGIEEARRIYSIPEYRERFNKWGTLGDTFVDDATARINNVKLQGRSKKLDIKGQHGVHGGAYTSPDATTIGITNSDSSDWIYNMIRHETNHVGHGLIKQPSWMSYHNEKIRPVLREGKDTTSTYGKYLDEMDEIVERSKTAVEYADRIRKEGESLNDALTRLADMADANIYDASIPSDIRQMMARFTKNSTLNFWKNFVGGVATPVGIGYGLMNEPDNITFNKGKDSGIHIKPENRGKFNALKKRTGKTTEQLTHSKNPLTRKRAIFALNSKKWKH